MRIEDDYPEEAFHRYMMSVHARDEDEHPLCFVCGHCNRPGCPDYVKHLGEAL